MLLHACATLRDRGWGVSAIHVDHGLHADSPAWARHCQRVCAGLALACRVERVDVVGGPVHGLEEAARRARYACLARHIGSGEVLLTAHHQDDQAETLLLQLLRGAGAHGLAAMPALTAFAGGQHARPLLGVARAALAAYARAQQLAWIEDPSNRDVRRARNYVRLELLPVLRRRWPQANHGLARTARHMAEAAALLDELAAIDVQACGESGGSLHIPRLLQLSPARRRNAIRAWIRARGLRVPSERVLAQIMARLAPAPRSASALVAWADGVVRRYRDQLVLAQREAATPAYALRWDLATVLELPGQRLRAVAAVGEGLSRARLAQRSIVVRSRRGGEVCQLAGREHHTKLKKLLQASGVPPWERATLPLVYVDGTLAAIGDRWVCEPFRAHAGEAAWRLVLERVDGA